MHVGRIHGDQALREKTTLSAAAKEISRVKLRSAIWSMAMSGIASNAENTLAENTILPTALILL